MEAFYLYKENWCSWKAFESTLTSLYILRHPSNTLLYINGFLFKEAMVSQAGYGSCHNGVGAWQPFVAMEDAQPLQLQSVRWSVEWIQI